MEKDPSELTDLSAQYPERVAQMAALWHEWTKTVPVYPTPWEQRQPIRPEYVAPLY